MTSNLLELAARCEAATGPNWKLAVEIWKVAAPEAYEGAQRRAYYSGNRQRAEVPAYTASIDAALTLAPDGHSWMLSVGGMAIAQVTDCTGDVCTVPPDFDGHAATPALALCAAALKARASGPSDE